MSSRGTIVLDADILVSIYSYPEGTGYDPVILGKGKVLPSDVTPKKAKYKSFEEKLFW